MQFSPRIIILVLVVLFGVSALEECNGYVGNNVPPEIREIFQKSMYDNAIWGLRVEDLETGEVLINLRPDYRFFIGSVRKIFTVGELLNQFDSNHRFTTPVYKQGALDDQGVLDGELVLVASGDLTMGGRTNPDGTTIAISDYDHNEANSLGNAVLTTRNPLAGYIALADQIARSGITQVADVVIDDRLFVPYLFRNEFEIRAIFVNDDVVDLTINPNTSGMPASVTWRPNSAALGVKNELITSGKGTAFTLKLNPELPLGLCLPDCTAAITGGLPVDFDPPLTGKFPLVRTFRIVEPQNYARTVFIEALENAGVAVLAETVAPNPTGKLPPKNSYSQQNLVTTLVSMPYEEYAKLILKVSYNIGADTSLILYGLTQGVDNMHAALSEERALLTTEFGIPGDEFVFVDGSGGGQTKATTPVITKWLTIMRGTKAFVPFFEGLPGLGDDGSLAFVDHFESDPTLKQAKGQVRAKTGTFAEEGVLGDVRLRGQALAGYVKTKSGKTLVFQLVVNEVRLSDVKAILQVFQDQGTISAILWRNY